MKILDMITYKVFKTLTTNSHLITIFFTSKYDVRTKILLASMIYLEKKGWKNWHNMLFGCIDLVGREVLLRSCSLLMEMEINVKPNYNGKGMIDINNNFERVKSKIGYQINQSG